MAAILLLFSVFFFALTKIEIKEHKITMDIERGRFVRNLFSLISWFSKSRELRMCLSSSKLRILCNVWIINFQDSFSLPILAINETISEEFLCASMKNDVAVRVFASHELRSVGMGEREQIVGTVSRCGNPSVDLFSSV